MEKMINNILLEEEFIEYSKNNNIKTICFYDVTLDNKQMIELNMSEKEFLEIAKAQNKPIFYRYDYLTQKDLLISSRTFSDASFEIDELAKKLGLTEDFLWFLDENLFPDETPEEEKYDYTDEFSKFEYELVDLIKKSNDNVDLSILKYPQRATFFYINEGYLIALKKYNFFNNRPSQSLYDILIKYEKELQEGEKRLEENAEKVKEEFINRLLNEPKFILATNQKTRRHFAESLRSNKEYVPILKIVFPSKTDYNHIDYYELTDFIDQLYLINKPLLNEKRKEIKSI